MIRNSIPNYYTDYPLDYFINIVTNLNQLQWDDKKQSYFIESILMGLPVLNIVVSQSEEIIDGRQRLLTAINFINNNLTLIDLKTLTELNGFKFKDLLWVRQQKFKKITVRAYGTLFNGMEQYGKNFH